MGIAIISGMLASLEERPANGNVANPSSRSGTSTPLPNYMLYTEDNSLPSKFTATVRRPESAKKLKKLFVNDFAESGEAVEVRIGDNVEAAKDCDVLLLWYVTSDLTSKVVGGSADVEIYI